MKILNNINSQIHYDYIQGDHSDQVEVLVLIHSIGLNMQQWNDIIPYLKNDYKLLRYDLRGHGDSTSQGLSVSFEELLGDLIYLLEHLQIKEFHLISDLAGGRLVIKLANLLAGRVKSLVLSSAICFIPELYTQNIIIFFRNWLEEDPESFARYFSKSLNYLPTSERSEIIYKMITSVRSEVLRSYLHILLDNYPSDFFQTWTVPTLHLVGENNPFVPWRLASTFSIFTRNLIVPNAAQLISMDQPALVASWIKDFISSLELNRVTDWDDRVNSVIKNYTHNIIQKYLNRLKPETVDHMHVEILQSFRVWMNEKEVLDNWNKRLAKRIFVFLLVYRTVTRQQLYNVFWPQHNLMKAQNHLRVSLNHLKKLLTPEGKSESPFLWSDREHIGLKGRITCDFSKFIKKLEVDINSMDPLQSYENCIDILNVFTGYFLPGLYDDWLIKYRSHIEEKALYLIQGTIEALTKSRLEQRANFLKKRLEESSIYYIQQIEDVL